MVRFYGDWGKAKLWFNKMETADFNKVFRKELKALGKAVVVKLKSHITRQDLPWEQLAPFTVKKKGHAKIYIETRQYKNSMHAKVRKSGKRALKLVVFPKGTHVASGLPMQELGMYLEYGTSRIPARPIWRPTYEEMKKMPEFKRLIDMEKKFGFDAVL
jgi:hypothetical protein